MRKIIIAILRCLRVGYEDQRGFFKLRLWNPLSWIFLIIIFLIYFFTGIVVAIQYSTNEVVDMIQDAGVWKL